MAQNIRIVAQTHSRENGMQDELMTPGGRFEEVAPPESKTKMAAEVAQLDDSRKLYTSGQYEVLIAQRADIPTIVREIGRLRELSFRAVEEGTGQARDLDVFDDWYMHLLVWDAAEQQVLGAYRIGLTDIIVREQGVEGLYTSTLFNFGHDFFEQLGPALEMGRSFVRPEYQRSSMVLAFLWRGIGRFISMRPRYGKMFGPVSVSHAYTERSRQIIANSLLSDTHRHELHERVGALRPVGADELDDEPPETDMKRLNKQVSAEESDGKGIPVLVREYVKLGGRFLAFSIDPAFGNAMDGLVAVDLKHTSPRLLKLYMGPEAYAHFERVRRQSHQPEAATTHFANV